MAKGRRGIKVVVFRVRCGSKCFIDLRGGVAISPRRLDQVGFFRGKELGSRYFKGLGDKSF